MVATDLVLVRQRLPLLECEGAQVRRLTCRHPSSGYGFAFGLVFFGANCLVSGQLIRWATYLPQTLGVLMQLAGVCYVVNSVALVLSPPVASRLLPYILLPPFIAELSLASWLLMKGVKQERWDAIQANADGPQ